MEQKDRIFHIGLSLSTANLLLLSVWQELLYTDAKSHYYMFSAPATTDYLAAVADMLLLAVLFFVALHLIQRTRIGWLMAVARITFLASLSIPLNTIRLRLPFQLGIGVLISHAQQASFYIPILIVGAFLGAIALRFRRQVFGVVAMLVFILLPFSAITCGQALVRSFAALNTPALGPARFSSSDGSYNGRTRVVWIIFDELDGSMTFSRRPAELKLPCFDTFRKEGVRATHARAPSNDTLISIPSLITGKLLTNISLRGASELVVTPKGSTVPVEFQTLPNVFSRAKKAGFQTTVVGWYHPYCRLLNGLDCCSWRPVFQTVTGQVAAEDKSFAGAMLDQLAAISPLNRRRLAIDAYRRILEDSKKAVARASGLIFLHFPIPHAPVIYNRAQGKLTTLMASNIQGYVDNLALADRTLSELRQVMEESGTWKRSAVIVSSDHIWRDASSYDGRNDPYIPFLVKIPGQSVGVDVDAEFQTIHTEELVLAILNGEITDNAAVAMWIQTHAELSKSASHQ